MQKKPYKELDFEEEKSSSNSFDVIRSEFYKKWIKRLVVILTILIIITFHFTFIYPQYLTSDNGTGITSVRPLHLSYSINWTLVSFGIFSIFYLVKLTLMKYTPSFKEYITHEIDNLGLKTRTKRNSILIFLLLNCSSILLLVLLELKFIKLNKSLTKTFFEAFLILFLFLSITVPVLWGLFYDGLTVKLKRNIHIFILPDYKIRRHKMKESKLIEVYMISNRIAFNFSKSKRELYSKIADARWLPRRSKFMIFRLKTRLFLRFREYSTPISFQKQLLNISLALQEWDTQIK